MLCLYLKVLYVGYRIVLSDYHSKSQNLHCEEVLSEHYWIILLLLTQIFTLFCNLIYTEMGATATRMGDLMWEDKE